MNDFKQNPNLLLYAKGWYVKTGNIVEDIVKCLNADGYDQLKPNMINDTISIVVRYTMNLQIKDNNLHPDKIVDMLSKLNPDNTKQMGYMTPISNYGVHKYEYDYATTVLWYCLSELGMLNVEICGSLPEPNPEVLELYRAKQI